MTPGIVGESDLSGNLTDEYVFFDGERVAHKSTNGVFYYFSDHLKTASVITDASGNIKSESDFYPWGGELQFVNNDSNHYKFTGKERDGETGLDYFGARNYSNGLGRFITPDWAAKATAVPYAEFADPQSLNLYSYVRNIPTVKVDPDGHDTNGLDHEVKGFDQRMDQVDAFVVRALNHPAVQAILMVATFGEFGGAEEGAAAGVAKGLEEGAAGGATKGAEGAASGAAKGSEGAASGAAKGSENAAGSAAKGSEEGGSAANDLGRSSTTKQSGAQGQNTTTTVKDPAGSTTYKTTPGKTGGQSTIVVRKDANGKTIYVKQEARNANRDFNKPPDHVHYKKPNDKEVK
jgi:RHS repeat-associated protein